MSAVQPSPAPAAAAIAEETKPSAPAKVKTPIGNVKLLRAWCKDPEGQLEALSEDQRETIFKMLEVLDNCFPKGGAADERERSASPTDTSPTAQRKRRRVEANEKREAICTAIQGSPLFELSELRRARSVASTLYKDKNVHYQLARYRENKEADAADAKKVEAAVRRYNLIINLFKVAAHAGMALAARTTQFAVGSESVAASEVSRLVRVSENGVSPKQPSVVEAFIDKALSAAVRLVAPAPGAAAGQVPEEKKTPAGAAEVGTRGRERGPGVTTRGMKRRRDATPSAS